MGNPGPLEPKADGGGGVPDLHCGDPEYRRDAAALRHFCREGPFHVSGKAGTSEILLRHRRHQRGAVHRVLLLLPETVLSGGGIHPALHGPVLRGADGGHPLEGAGDEEKNSGAAADVSGMFAGLRDRRRRDRSYHPRYFAGTGGGFLLRTVQHFWTVRPAALQRFEVYRLDVHFRRRGLAVPAPPQ